MSKSESKAASSGAKTETKTSGAGSDAAKGPAAAQRLSNTVFVRWTINDLTLAEQLPKATAAHVHRGSGAQQRSFGFVTFENAEDAAKATKALHGERLVSDNCVVQYASVKGTGETKSDSTSEREEDKKRLYVRWTISNETVASTFGKFGKVVDARRVHGPVTKAYGFVDFETEEDAAEALKRVNGTPLRSGPMVVQPAETAAPGRRRRRGGETKQRKRRNREALAKAVAEGKAPAKQTGSAAGRKATAAPSSTDAKVAPAAAGAAKPREGQGDSKSSVGAGGKGQQQGKQQSKQDKPQREPRPPRAQPQQKEGAGDFKASVPSGNAYGAGAGGSQKPAAEAKQQAGKKQAAPLEVKQQQAAKKPAQQQHKR